MDMGLSRRIEMFCDLKDETKIYLKHDNRVPFP